MGQINLDGNKIKELIDSEMRVRKEICGKSVSGDTEAIDKELLKISMFVEAGAGAGKTFTIVQRVLNQLCIGIKPSEIVVITFTNKAAEELRSRIAAQLKNRIDNRDKNEDYSAYLDQLKYAFSHIDDMNISTIHSFCFKLLKERCFDAKIPMDVGLLDNQGTDEQKNSIFEDWMSNLNYQDWENLQKNDPNGRYRSQIKKEIKGIYDKICTTPIERHVHIEDNSIDMKFAETVYRRVERAVVDMVNARNPQDDISSIEDVLGLADRLGDKTFLGSNWYSKDNNAWAFLDENGNVDYEAFLRIFLKKGDTDNKRDGEEKVYCEYSSKSAFKLGKQYKKNDPEKARLNELYEQVYSFIDDNIDDISKVMNAGIIAYSNIINTYAQMAKDYYRRMASILMLTNDALLELTRDMILGSDEAQAYFAEKYLCFYVDEFQDTDSIQESFIWRLASKTENCNELRDGALFIVGDPKQSIYRFRGAEPDVYLSVKERMRQIQESGGRAKVYDLQINFRSNNLVINWVNEKFETTDGFEPIMVAKGGNPEYEYQSMLAKNSLDESLCGALSENGYGLTVDSETQSNIIAGVYQYHYPEKDGERVEEKDAVIAELLKQRLEALDTADKELDMQDLADLIINLCDNEKYKIVKKGKTEPIYFGDILVLCASKTNMNAYLEHMNKRGIPVQIAGNTDPKASLELNAYIRIYSYLANRKSSFDRAAAVEAFRCLNVTRSEEELDRLADTITGSAYKECKNMTAYGLAIYLLKHLSVIFQKDKRYTAFEIQSVQTKIVQMIESVCRNNYGTQKDIANEFYKYLDTKIEHEVSLVDRTTEETYTKESQGAVRFMNIHKSKGLEGNIVIVVDRHGKKPSASFILHDNEYYPRPKQYKALKVAEDKELAAERRRLEYVTATRAGQALIFMDYLNGEPLFGGAEGSKYDLSGLPSIAPVILSEKPNMEPTLKNIQYDLEGEEQRINSGKNHINIEEILPDCQRISPSNFENGQSRTKNRAIARAHKVGVNLEEEDSRILPRPVGNIFGTTMHRALELLVGRYEAISKLPPAKKETAIISCSIQAVQENQNEIIPTEIEKYKLFLNAIVLAYYKELVKLGWLDHDNVSIYTELPFSFYESDTIENQNQLYFANKHLNEAEKLKLAPVWMNGSADLILRFNAGCPEEEILIIDYKSDNDRGLLDSEFDISMSEKYIGQLDNYRYAIQKIWGINPTNITMRVVSFTQKDTGGQLFDDDTVRVRITKIDENVIASDDKAKSNEIPAEKKEKILDAEGLTNKQVIKEFVSRCEANPNIINDELLSKLMTTEFGSKQFGIGKKHPLLVEITGKSQEEIKVLRCSPARYYKPSDVCLHVHGRDFLVNKEWYNNERCKNLQRLINWMNQVFIDE